MERTDAELSDCRVTGAEFLPAETGGADALCGAVRSARGSSGASPFVQIRIESPHMMVATQTLKSGEILAEVRTARADRPLGRRSFQMLAEALAAQLKVAGK